MIIEMPLVPFKHGGWVLSRPATVIGAQMNCAYVAAAVLCDGQALAQQFSPDRIASEDIWDLMRRIEVRHNEEMDALAAETGSKRVTRITLTTMDGHTEQVVVKVALGQGHKLMTDQQIVTKFRMLTELVMPRERSRALENAVLDIEERTRDVIDLLADPVEPLFTDESAGQLAGELRR
jgi:aconitate decarboxylase